MAIPLYKASLFSSFQRCLSEVNRKLLFGNSSDKLYLKARKKGIKSRKRTCYSSNDIQVVINYITFIIAKTIIHLTVSLHLMLECRCGRPPVVHLCVVWFVLNQKVPYWSQRSVCTRLCDVRVQVSWGWVCGMLRRKEDTLYWNAFFLFQWEYLQIKWNILCKCIKVLQASSCEQTIAFCFHALQS